ncbi:hypothetical protein CPB86DRAFT_814880 [Serendipita vermifera]|nr:hypothetical protein CPB86DRAFT_814880 [Serendipita vermifera]
MYQSPNAILSGQFVSNSTNSGHFGNGIDGIDQGTIDPRLISHNPHVYGSSSEMELSDVEGDPSENLRTSVSPNEYPTPIQSKCISCHVRKASPSTPHTSPPDDLPGAQELSDSSKSVGEPLPSPDFPAFDVGIVSNQSGPTPNQQWTQLTWNANEIGPLDINSPEIQFRLKVLRDTRNLKLIPLVKWILASDWYHNNAAEQLPPEGSDLRRLIKSRGSLEACNSPFSAFLSDKIGRSSYECLLCRGQPGTKPISSLQRVLGHVRRHFNFKKIGKYYDENTKRDQERRQEKPKKHCNICKRKIAIQNWQRHCKTATHQKKEKLSQSKHPDHTPDPTP